MTGLQILHTIIFIVFGVVSICEVKGVKKSKKYINLSMGVLALLIAAYDILVTGFGIRIL